MIFFLLLPVYLVFYMRARSYSDGEEPGWVFYTSLYAVFLLLSTE